MTSQRPGRRGVATRPWAISLAALAAFLGGADAARADRPWLHEFAPAEQRDLGRRILGYLTDEELHWHMNIDHDEPRSFFHGHRAYLARLEGHLARTGGGRFVPLPKWDPARPIPAGLRGVRPGYRPLERHAVEMPVPAAFRGPALARYGDLASLFEAVRPYHDAVHERVGGCMADAMTAPAAAVFFCWHATLDDLFGEWARRTGYRIAAPSADDLSGRIADAPGMGGDGRGTGQVSTRRSLGREPGLPSERRMRMPPPPLESGRPVVPRSSRLFVEGDDGFPLPFGWETGHGGSYHDAPYQDVHPGGPYHDGGYGQGAPPPAAGFDGPSGFAGPESWDRPSWDDPSWHVPGPDRPLAVPGRPPAVFHFLP